MNDPDDLDALVTELNAGAPEAGAPNGAREDAPTTSPS